jgi:hypothetical protein
MATISLQKTFYKIGDFIGWQKAGTLVLSPDFQRRSVWKKGTKSYLIDTIIRGLPIPVIFLRDRRIDTKTFEPEREVIDGQQRLRTVISFVAPLFLPNFDPTRDEFTVQSAHNEEIANTPFAELSSDVQRRILEYEFNVHVLPSWVDDREVLQIFRRMNSTNYILKPQELRNAEYFGEFKTSVYELASEQLHRWREWKTFNEDDIARMQEVELTSEFVILILKKAISGKSKPGIDKYYEKYDAEYPERTEVERRFRITMDTINDKLGKDMPRLPFSKKTLIFTLFAFFYDALFGLDSPLTKTNATSISPEQVSWIKLAGERIQNRTAPKKALDASDRRTTNPKERRALFSYLRNGLRSAKSDSQSS